MKNLSLVLLMLFAFNTVALAAANVQEGKSVIVVKQESSSTFKGLLYRVWSRLRALNPRLETNKTRNRSAVTMGIRGAETTSSIIEPYWKGDKTDDPEYIIELTTYTEAQQFAEDGDLNEAVTALNAFLTEYEDSELRPNAQFALAISQGGMGNTVASKETLLIFIEENPKHPLVADAHQVINQL